MEGQRETSLTNSLQPQEGGATRKRDAGANATYAGRRATAPAIVSLLRSPRRPQPHREQSGATAQPETSPADNIYADLCVQRPILDEGAIRALSRGPTWASSPSAQTPVLCQQYGSRGGIIRLTACEQQAGGALPNSVVVLNPMKRGGKQGEHCQRRPKYLYLMEVQTLSGLLT